MATQCSILSWRLPQTEEPGRLQSTVLQRVRHDLATEQQEKETDLDLIVVRGINMGLPR